VTPQGTRPAAVAIRKGLIVGLSRLEDAPRASQVMDAGDAIVMPGIVDTHVHVNEPGRTDWEGFDSATRAAAAGGVTTLIDMPVHARPATTRAEALRAKMELAARLVWVDVGFWGGLGRGNLGQVAPLRDAGALGFKAFLIPPGSEELREIGEGELRVVLPTLRELGAPLIVHAELAAPIEQAWTELAAEGADSTLYVNWLRARPRAAENDAVALLLRLSEVMKAPVHIAQLTAADMLPELRRARAAGVPITVGTAPHYLHFAAHDIADRATELKCTPPIRDGADREAIWEALGDGTIDTIASAHSPCPPELKHRESGDFVAAWAGIAGVQLTLPVVWSAARVRGFSPHHLAEWLCAAPARLAGIAQRKGTIAPGRDADIVIWEPDAEVHVDAGMLHQRHRLTPYEGLSLLGKVRTTILRGEVVCADGVITGARRGRIIKH
jgi:allantoinase